MKIRIIQSHFPLLSLSLKKSYQKVPTQEFIELYALIDLVEFNFLSN